MSYVTKEPGDVGFTQYLVVTTKQIKNAVSVTKGRFYTVNDDGYVIALTASSGIVDNAGNGLFQAMTSSAAVTGESSGDRSCQFMVMRSRCIVKCDADLVPGQDVEIKAAAAVVTPDRVQARTATGKRLGTIYKIFADKITSAAGDRAYVEVFP